MPRPYNANTNQLWAVGLQHKDAEKLHAALETLLNYASRINTALRFIPSGSEHDLHNVTRALRWLIDAEGRA